MNVEAFGITWAAPQHMWLLPIVVMLLALVAWRVYRMFTIQKILTSQKWQSVILYNFSRVKIILKAVLMSVGILAMFCALLRPVTKKKEVNVEQEGRDVFIALDISRSMLATDAEPNRLECAKEKIRRLLSMLKAERVGLILFSGSALIQCPLTTDYPAFFMFLDQVDVETISSGSTAIDQAIRKALAAFPATEEKKTKLLVLFTDGEDFSSNLRGIKKKAKDAGLHIFTLGVGTTEGAPIPLYDASGKQSGHQQDKFGKVVISRLNEGILHTLAQDSGGMYLRCGKDESLKTLVKKIETFEKEKFDDKKMEMFEEQYPYFLLVSFISFALEWII